MVVNAPRGVSEPADVGVGLIDSDVHTVLTGTLDEVFEYMPRAQREKVAYLGRIPLRESPLAYTFLIGRWAVGANAEPVSEAPRGSSPHALRVEVLDGQRVEAAQLIATEAAAHALQARNYDLSAALTSAFNEYVLEHWVTDERTRYALMVCPGEPAAAVAEIRRHGNDRRVSSLWVPAGAPRFGDRYFNPVYEAALEFGLPILSHPGGPGMSMAPAEYGMEGRFTSPLQAWSNIASLVAHGTAQRYPELRFVFAECGFTWLVPLLARMDSAWRGGAGGAGAAKRAPSDLVREQVRITTSPLDDDRSPELLAQLIEDPSCPLSEVLVYSSNYPRSGESWPGEPLEALSPAAKRRIFSENARSVLRI